MGGGGGETVMGRGGLLKALLSQVILGDVSICVCVCVGWCVGVWVCVCIRCVCVRVCVTVCMCQNVRARHFLP